MSRPPGATRRTARLTLVALLAMAGEARAAADAADGDASHAFESAVVPLLGGDTDIGFGAGVLGSLARLDPQARPFRWRLDGAAFATVKPRQLTRYEWPYQDVFAVYTHNGLFSPRVRFELRASYTRETDLRYYGIGNASVAPAEDVAARDFFTRVHPAGRARARIPLSGPTSLVLGSTYTFSRLELDPSSRLARDQVGGSPQLDALLLVDRSHALHLFEAGLSYDTRENEIAPSRGQFHQLEVRLAPWQSERHPYRYAELHASSRVYQAIAGDRLVLAARAVGYLQIGDVPFYELSRYDETSALGGAKGVRGIPKNRYYGKRKVFGNFEARSRLFTFRMGRNDVPARPGGLLRRGAGVGRPAERPRARRHRLGTQIRCRRRAPAAEGNDLPSALRPGLVARRPADRRLLPRRPPVLRGPTTT